MHIDPNRKTTRKQRVKGKPTGRSGQGPSGPKESFEPGRAREASGIHKPRSKRHYRADNPQFRDASAQVEIATAGLQGGVAVSSLKYPDGRWDLKALAAKALQNYDLATTYPKDVQKQVDQIVAELRPPDGSQRLPADANKPWVRDMTHVPLVSVDNGTLWTEMDPAELEKNPEANVSSRDIDQLQSASLLGDNLETDDIRVTVMVSDLDAVVKKGSPLDRFMDVNTSSVYTPDKVFNLVPPELAEDIVSLNPREDRLGTFVEYTVKADGTVTDGEVFQGIGRSRTKLDYSSVGAWLEGKAEPSPAMRAQGPDLEQNLRIQAEASRRIEGARDRAGALEFDRTEMRIITEDGNAVRLEESRKNTATEMVENFMVTTNTVMSEFLRAQGYPTLERTVPEPEKWDDIVSLAKEHGSSLPKQPDGQALSKFLEEQKKKDPEGASDLSLSVIKLIGRGQYEGVGPDEELPGHFPLGVTNYMQSTASIRRGGDRVSTRMLKAALAGERSPYGLDELKEFALNLSEKERMVKKAERMADKMATATMLEDRIGERFQAVVTGTHKGRVFCRIGNPPVEGSLFKADHAKVGDKFTVELEKVNVEKGWIDFEVVRGR